MHLVARDMITGACHIIRPLSAAEIKFDREAAPIYFEASNRLGLFTILKENYNAWCQSIQEHLSPGKNVMPKHRELDRLMFNFLAAAYGIVEHFETSYRRRFKKNSSKLQEYKDFVSHLCKNSWAVAFFLDFRNYVQHVELPIGHISRSEQRNSVSISVTQDAGKLLKASNRWPHSKLSADKGTIDLISLTDDFYITFVRNYGDLVARTFYPELKKIDSFFRQLTLEVRSHHPNTTMGYLLDDKHIHTATALTTTTTYSERPNFVFEELGISVKQ